MEQLSNLLDELHLGTEKGVQKVLEPDEKILLSCGVFKFNRKNKRQERNIMITTKAIYNLSKISIKRKIMATKIQGVTYSKMSSEFVIHIPEEYDYRYSSYDKQS